jgi:hypothetical protein
LPIPKLTTFRGPNWIHTSDSNPILDLAAQTNTPMHVWNEKIQLFDQAGHRIDETRAKELSDLRWDIINEAFVHSVQNASIISEFESLYDFLVARAQERLPSNAKDQALLLGMSQMWGAYIGDPIEQQSLKYAWLEQCCGGGKPLLPSYLSSASLHRQV